MGKNVVVILNYNDCDETMNYVKKIYNYDAVNYIVVVDNASPNNDYKNLCTLENHKVAVIQAGINNGYSAGNNCGLRYAFKTWPDIEVVFISNPDIIISNKTIKEIHMYLTSHEKCAVASGYIHSPGRDEIRAWCVRDWIAFMYGSRYIFSYLRYKYLFNHQSLTGKYLTKICKEKSYVEVGCIEGSFFGIKKSFLEKIGLFDENIFLYYEEDILGIQVQKYGLKEVVLTKNKITHIGGTSTPYGNLEKQRLFMISALYVMKNYLQCNDFQLLLYKYSRLLSIFIQIIKWKFTQKTNKNLSNN